MSWPEFTIEALQLENSLDDTKLAFSLPTFGIDSRAVAPAADEADVRGVIYVAVQGVNAAAAHLGIKAEYAGGGSGRSSSLTDLVVRKSGEQSDLQPLSRLVLGAVEIKGSWQFSLQRGETLKALVHDRERIDGVLLALQQVF